MTSHHDNITSIKIGMEYLSKSTNYLRDKTERDYLYLTASRNRVIDLKINNYDKIIDLEIFLLKLFIPILSISFAAGIKIFGINTYMLKILSFWMIIFTGLLMVLTLLLRTKIITSEREKHDKEVSLIKKKNESMLEDLESHANKLEKEIQLSLENES